jgi:choline dehydrogenase
VARGETAPALGHPRRLRQGGAAGRHPAQRDFNRGSNEGVGYFQVNQKNGWRWNTAKAFLRPTCYGRPNFELWTGAQVSRLLFETAARRHAPLHRRRGLDRQRDGARARHARGDAVRRRHRLAADPAAVGHRPGRAAAPARHPVVQDLPGVGENLQDHLQIRAVYKVDGVATLNTLANSWWGKAKIGLEYLLKRSGPMSMAPSQLGAFTRSSPDQPWPNIEYHVQPLSASTPSASRCTLQCLHRQRVQPQPHQPGLGAHPQQQASRTRRPSRPTT